MDNSKALGLISTSDICLASWNGSEWSCLKDRNGRLAYPVNTPSTQVYNEVSNPLPDCKAQAYAFVNIPLPPAPSNEGLGFDWWKEYGQTILIALGCTGLVVLIFLGVSWRLKKWRQEFQETKKALEKAEQEGNELREFGAGLGMADADGELQMEANPIQIQLRDAARAVEKQHITVKAQGQAEEMEIQRLEMERQKMHAEMLRVQGQLERDASSTPLNVAGSWEDSSMGGLGGLGGMPQFGGALRIAGMPPAPAAPSSSFGTFGNQYSSVKKRDF